ncbi:MAG: protein translocase subunit SecF, partial [Dehalococcoidia bacterium]
YAVIAAAVGILLYITWAFRRLVHPISYGVCAIVALLHDALIVLGVFSLFSLEVNSMFIIALLTVIGYSVNDTIVVFDRIRENRRRDINADFASIVNVSLTGTLGRSLSTSLTTLFVLFALLLFGGATISNFVLALAIGVIVGTYSSLFIASPLVVSWERGELGRLFDWIPLRRERG